MASGTATVIHVRAAGDLTVTDKVVNADVMPDEVHGHPALEVLPHPAKADQADGGVLGQQDLLAPAGIGILAAAVLADGRAGCSLYIRPGVNVGDVVNHAHSSFGGSGRGIQWVTFFVIYLVDRIAVTIYHCFHFRSSTQYPTNI